MPEINANFVVQPYDITIVSDVNNLNVAVEPVNLNVFSQGYAQPEGDAGQLQYNLDGQNFAGAANTDCSNGNVRFTNISNLKINGGNSGFYLQTDGAGTLTWAAGTANVTGGGSAAGANNQIQLSDGTGNFKVGPGFSFDPATNIFTSPGNIVGTNANFSANLVVSGNANITNNLIVGSNANITGNINANNGTFTNNVTANIITANSFVGTISNAVNANYANFAGNVTIAAQPNITSVGNLTDLRVNNNKIHLGNNAGATSQDINSIAIGEGAGRNNQSLNSVAIGYEAGNQSQGSGTVAIGYWAGRNNQSSGAIALGESSGVYGQNSRAIAVGQEAGTQSSSATPQGANSIAIGYRAATLLESIAIGTLANAERNNAIVLNATGSPLPANADNTFTVKPIRNSTAANILYYDQSTGEILYSSPSPGTFIANGTSNVSMATANGNVNITVNNVSTMNVTSTGANITGTLNVSGNANVNNLGTTQVLASANVTAPRFISNVSTGTAPFTVTSTTLVANLNVANATYAANAGNATIANSALALSAQNVVTANYIFHSNVSNRGMSSLPSASGNAGYRTVVNDANTVTFLAIVGGGGSNVVPVYSDGTNWRVG